MKPETKGQHTKGELTRCDDAQGTFAIISKKRKLTVAVFDNGYLPPYKEFVGDGIGRPERQANVDLFFDALTVTNECGLTPRELLGQREMLLEELKRMVSIFGRDIDLKSYGENSIGYSAVMKAKQAITLATSTIN